MATVSSATKHFVTAKEGFTTTLASTIASGATTVPLNSVSGYTNGDQVALVIEPTSTTAKQVFTGTVDTSGVQITGVVWTEGTNQTHNSGSTVVDYETATAWALYAKGLKVQHNQDGTHAAVTATSVTASGNVGGATLSSSGASTLNSVVTNTIGASGSNHLALSAGSSKLVKTTVLRQDDTTNTYEVGNSVVLTGWGVITPGAAATASETVTFGVTFLQPPIVLVTAGGDNASATTYGSGALNIKIPFGQAMSITTTNFVASLRSSDGTNWSAGNTVFYQWVAIGEI